MIVLGIDPGVRKCGYAVVDFSESMPRILDAGIVLNEINTKIKRSDYYERMSQISIFFEELLNTYAINQVVVEKLFFTTHNQSNAEFVYGMRGICMMMIHRRGIPIAEYTPLQLKKTITWNGKASKELVQSVVVRLYHLTHVPEWDDAADALGLCRMWRVKKPPLEERL